MRQRSKVATVLVLSAIVLSACSSGGKAASGTTTGAGAGTAASTGVGGSGVGGSATGGAGSTGAGGPSTQKTMSGDITWQLTFDAAAHTAGDTDCSYTRHYEAVEDASAPWLCPTCDVLYKANVTMTAGQTCYGQLSKTPTSATEWIGYGGTTWFRSPGGPTAAQGTATIAGSTLTTTNMTANATLTTGGTVSFQVMGSLNLGQQPGDPRNGFVPPASYACGWPQASPPLYAGNYVLKKGQPLPDGLFKDKCGETVRLQDFAGKYLIVDMAAMDCGPCQMMASQEEQLIADMAVKGIDVQVITLLCPSLSDPFGDTTTADLDAWINNFHLKTPVLGDRGWGAAMFVPAIGAANVGYPAWAVVGKDLKVLDFKSGYPSALADFETIIAADAH